MRIIQITAKNYRSLEDLKVEFNPYYNALSGKNNSGKSNIIRAILGFLSYDFNVFRNFSKPIDYSNDYPYWKKKDKENIEVEILLELDKENDAGLFKFIRELIFKEEETEENQNEILKINAIQEPDSQSTNVEITFGDHIVLEEFKRDELLNRLRGSESILFHNSTENEPFFFARTRRDSLSSYLTSEDLESITKKKESLERAVKKSLQMHQTEFRTLLGRLTEKYDVSLGINSLNLDREPIDISLKEKGIEVSLEDWGSGTKNRTLILLNLMNAKRLQASTGLTPY